MKGPFLGAIPELVLVNEIFVDMFCRNCVVRAASSHDTLLILLRRESEHLVARRFQSGMTLGIVESPREAKLSC